MALALARALQQAHAPAVPELLARVLDLLDELPAALVQALDVELPSRAAQVLVPRSHAVQASDFLLRAAQLSELR